MWLGMALSAWAAALHLVPSLSQNDSQTALASAENHNASPATLPSTPPARSASPTHDDGSPDLVNSTPAKAVAALQRDVQASPGLEPGVALPLNTDGITRIVELGRGRIELWPLGHALDVVVKQSQTRAGSQHISLESRSGLVSTVTLRGERFAATLATREGVYRVRGDLRGSMGLAHRSLDDHIALPVDYARPEAAG